VNDFAVRFGPWALVTGASSGIGEAFARRLAARGMDLVLVARREDRLGRLATELAGRHGIATRIVPVDLASDDFLPVVAEATHDLDIGLVVNNAGVLRAGAFLDHDLEDQLYQLDLNARAMLVLAHHFGRRLRERRRGGMIFLASTVAFAGVPGMSAYAASKAHVLTFAEGFASEVAHDGIAVLALLSGADEYRDLAERGHPGATHAPGGGGRGGPPQSGEANDGGGRAGQPADHPLDPVRPAPGELDDLRQGGRRDAQGRHHRSGDCGAHPDRSAPYTCPHGMTRGGAR
jgi:NAD(P)-dependent dehydrogenase (short-subunit alcohol dehydrogenase family)